MATITIVTDSFINNDALIKDLGIIIPGAGGSLTFTDGYNNFRIRQSNDLRSLVNNDAVGPGESTLSVTDGTNTYTGTNAINFLDAAPNIIVASTEVSASSTQTTTSASYVTIPSMTISNLTSGTYFVIFTGTVGNSTATSGVFVELFYNEGAGFTAITASEVFADTLAANYRVVATSVAIRTLTVSGSAGQFEARWHVEANTATVVNRHLVVVQLGARTV